MEQQLDPTRCHVLGVRMLAGWLFFINLDSARSLQYLLRHSFQHRIRLSDVSAQTWVVSLSGVPHYISDATVSLLLAAFGTICRRSQQYRTPIEIIRASFIDR